MYVMYYEIIIKSIILITNKTLIKRNDCKLIVTTQCYLLPQTHTHTTDSQCNLSHMYVGN